MPNRMRAFRPPLRDHREPSVGFASGLGDDAVGDFALEHQRQRRSKRRPGRGLEPADQKRRGDIVGEVGDDAARRRQVECREVDLERVALDDGKPSGIGGRDLGKRGEAARVRLDRDHARARLPGAARA